MKLFKFSYSVYDDETWYNRQFRGLDEEDAYMRWERYLELQGQEADMWDDPVEICDELEESVA